VRDLEQYEGASTPKETGKDNALTRYEFPSDRYGVDGEIEELARLRCEGETLRLVSCLLCF
jgi:hypothetical protein